MRRIHEIAGEVRRLRNPNRNGIVTTGRGHPGAARLSIRVCASVCSSDEQGARRQALENVRAFLFRIFIKNRMRHLDDYISRVVEIHYVGAQPAKPGGSLLSNQVRFSGIVV
jgi:hypothetical protein